MVFDFVSLFLRCFVFDLLLLLSIGCLRGVLSTLKGGRWLVKVLTLDLRGLRLLRNLLLLCILLLLRIVRLLHWSGLPWGRHDGLL